MAPVDDIIAEAKTARRILGDLEQDLQEEIDEIRFLAFSEKRPLTDAEKATLNERRAEKSEARAAQAELIFVTLQRINQSDELQVLKRKMDEINKGLKDDLDHLKTIARYAKVAADVAESVEKVATQVAAVVI